MTHQQQNLDIFPINSASDILRLPQVGAAREALIKLYKTGSEDIHQAEDEYLDLVNSLCEQHGLKPYFIVGPAHPWPPVKYLPPHREPAGPRK